MKTRTLAEKITFLNLLQYQKFSARYFYLHSGFYSLYLSIMKYLNNQTACNIFLLLARLWLGRSMILGGQSILRFFSSQELRDFFQNWFGKELGFPAPLLMAFMAKGTEFVCGILVCLGLFTRISSVLLAIVMLVATLTANLDYSGKESFIRPDGLVTISCFLFACMLALQGAGKYSIDNVIGGRK